MEIVKSIGRLGLVPLVLCASAAAAEPIHERACNGKQPGASPWHISNLYDCRSRTLYIPYHLWTGMPWDGRKDRPCMHKAYNHFLVNGRSQTVIRGPENWNHPKTGEALQIWIREKVRGHKVQYFVCHERGIGRVYDSRRERVARVGRCKFPAGRGWKVGERRECRSTAIEITRIDVDDDGLLAGLEFKYFSRGRLDHIYRYVPRQGMTNAWKQ